MTEISVYLAVGVISAALAMIAGRVFAIEGGRGAIAILAAGYVGAGVGLMTAVLIGPVLTLLAQYLSTETSSWFDALDVAGKALLSGTFAGTLGGLAIGAAIAMLPTRWLS